MEPSSNRDQPRIVDLSLWIDELTREEDAISLRRRLLQGRRDFLRAERAARVLGRHVSVDSLPDILTGSGRPPDRGLGRLQHAAHAADGPAAEGEHEERGDGDSDEERLGHAY